MRSLLAAAAIILLAPAVSQAEEKYQVRNAADLVAVCDAHAAGDAATALAFCHGFLAGAVHYYYASVPEADRFACASDPAPSRTDVMNDFVRWAGARPQYLNDPAVETLFRYLAETYPCP